MRLQRQLYGKQKTHYNVVIIFQCMPKQFFKSFVLCSFYDLYKLKNPVFLVLFEIYLNVNKTFRVNYSLSIKKFSRFIYLKINKKDWREAPWFPSSRLFNPGCHTLSVLYYMFLTKYAFLHAYKYFGVQ